MRTHEVLKSCRTLARLTQKQLARKTGIDSNKICLYENGRRVPNVDDLEILLNALGYQLVVVKAKGNSVRRPFQELRDCVNHITVDVIADHLKEESLFNWCGYIRGQMTDLINTIEWGTK